MKAQIEEIFLRLYENVQHGIEWEHAQNEIEQLMCYREVKAIIDWVNWKWWEDDFTEMLIEQLSTAYSRDSVLKSIEQYKSEHK